MALEELYSQNVGERLRIAREATGITQADAAAGIEVARTTLVAIEKGQRRIRPDELQRLARLYDTSVNALLRRESVYVDLVPRFRKLGTSTSEAADAAARLLADLVRAEVELENILGIKQTRNYPPERPIMPAMCERRRKTTRRSFVTGLALVKPRSVTSSAFWNSILAFASMSGVSIRAFPGCSPMTKISAPACYSTRITHGNAGRNPEATNSAT